MDTLIRLVSSHPVASFSDVVLAVCVVVIVCAALMAIFKR